jgi:hypothetical protein
VSESVNHDDDSRFFKVNYDQPTEEERTSHPPSPAPSPEDRSERAEHNTGEVDA